MTTLAQEISRKISAIDNCIASNNTEWNLKHRQSLQALCLERLPSGSGFDSGTRINTDLSTPEKLVFNTSYHHMNDSGYYDGWTDHTVTVKASLAFGIDIAIYGQNRNDIKNYMHDLFRDALTTEV